MYFKQVLRYVEDFGLLLSQSLGFLHVNAHSNAGDEATATEEPENSVVAHSVEHVVDYERLYDSPEE